MSQPTPRVVGTGPLDLPGPSASVSAARAPGSRAGLSPLGLGTRIAILLCASGLYFMSFFQRVAVPGTIFDEVQSAFSLSASGVAALGAVYLYLYSGLQPLAGILSDAWGPGRTLLASGLFLSLGALAFPCATSVALLYLTRALVGMGAALVYVSMTKELDELFGERVFPLVLAVGLVLGYAGGLFGTYPFERLVAAQGWRQALFEVGLAGALLWIVAVLLLGRCGRLERRPAGRLGVWVKTVLKNPDFLALTLSGSINFAIGFLLQATLGKKFLQDVCGVPSAEAAAFTFTMMLVCMTGVFCNGVVARHTHRRRPFVVLAACLTLTTSLLLLAGTHFGLSRGFFLACYALLGLAYSFAVIYGTAAKELNPREAAGTSIGLMNTGVYLTVAVVTSLAGAILDAYSTQAVRTATAVVYPREAYRAVFVLCVVLAVISCASALRLRERPQT